MPTDVVDALKEMAYFRLNVDQGMQGIKASEWDRLGRVEALTTLYMNRKEMDAKLGSLVNAIRNPIGQITIKQLSTEGSLR